MNVLFVSAGNSKNFDIVPFIKVQGDSLRDAGINIDYFAVNKKGMRGYFNNTIRLRRYLESKKIDIIHAHYTLSGWVAVFASKGIPIVLSLMGSDAYGDYVGPNKVKFRSRYLTLLTTLIQPFVNAIICKSEHIQSYVYLKSKSFVIPNGINLEEFKPTKKNYKKELGLDRNKKYILFLGNKSEIRKNYSIVNEISTITKNLEFLVPYPLTHGIVNMYLNSVNVLLVPSFMEGSPNVVKEAMACNCPVVATDVGDIRWLFGDEEGYFVTSFEKEDIIKNLKKAIAFSEKNGKTTGRDRLIKLGLESESVAKKIIKIYRQVLN